MAIPTPLPSELTAFERLPLEILVRVLEICNEPEWPDFETAEPFVMPTAHKTSIEARTVARASKTLHEKLVDWLRARQYSSLNLVTRKDRWGRSADLIKLEICWPQYSEQLKHLRAYYCSPPKFAVEAKALTTLELFVEKRAYDDLNDEYHLPALELLNGIAEGETEGAFPNLSTIVLHSANDEQRPHHLFSGIQGTSHGKAGLDSLLLVMTRSRALSTLQLHGFRESCIWLVKFLNDMAEAVGDRSLRLTLKNFYVEPTWQYRSDHLIFRTRSGVLPLQPLTFLTSLTLEADMDRDLIGILWMLLPHSPNLVTVRLCDCRTDAPDDDLSELYRQSNESDLPRSNTVSSIELVDCTGWVKLLNVLENVQAKSIIIRQETVPVIVGADEVHAMIRGLHDKSFACLQRMELPARQGMRYKDWRLGRQLLMQGTRSRMQLDSNYGAYEQAVSDLKATMARRGIKVILSNYLLPALRGEPAAAGFRMHDDPLPEDDDE